LYLRGAVQSIVFPVVELFSQHETATKDCSEADFMGA
jgi:hypothetical protein